jgi:hypothetical protein
MLEYFEHEAQPWGAPDAEEAEGDADDGPATGGADRQAARELVQAGPRPPSIRHISM